MSKGRKKIAVIGLPFYGHVMPILPLLKRLGSAGYHVHYYNTSVFEWAITGTGAEFYAYQSTLNHYPPVDLAFSAYNEEIGFVLPQVAARILNERYDLIIYDEYCAWIRCLILTHELRSVCIHTTYAVPLHDQKRPDKLVRGIEYSKTDEDYIKNNGLSKYVIAKERGGRLLFDFLSYLDEVVEHNRKLLGASSWDGWALLSAKADEDIVLVPEFFIETPHADYHYLATFQDIQPPERRTGNLVYVSLGTSYGEIEPLLAVIDGSGHNHNYQYVISSGNRPEEIKTDNPRVEIRPFVNQHEMLSSCAVFITHCGMNGVIEAILTETPMLLRPHRYEQRLTADVLSKMGLGTILENLSGANIEDAIYEAVASESMKSGLEACRQKIVSAGGLRRAMELIERLL